MRNTSLALACAGLLLAACATPYKSFGLGGGYKELRLADAVYQVQFTGNVKTSKDKVSTYWLYRCAELTKEQGYELFDIAFMPKPGNVSLAPSGAVRSAVFHPGQGRLILTHGGGGSGGGVYVYSGGGGTFWTSSGVVKMYHEPLPPQIPFAFRAQVVLDALKPYVDSGGDVSAPPREEIAKAARVVNPAYSSPVPGGYAAPPPPLFAPPAEPPPPADAPGSEPAQTAPDRPTES